MPTRYYKNAPSHTIPAGVANGTTTSIVVDSVTGWPTQFPFSIIVEPDTALEEACDVTAIVGTTLTVTRGIDGTTASAHAAGSVVVHGVIARDMTEANEHINDTTDIHGSTGALVDVGSNQTVSGNKTFSGTTTTNGAFDANGTNTFDGGTFFSAGLFSGSGGTNINGGWTAYTPTWKNGAGGSNLAIGSGTLVGLYQKFGKIVVATVLLTRAADTNVGTTYYAFGLPIAPANIASVWGSGEFLDSSAGAHYGRTVVGISGSEVALVDGGAIPVSNTSPVAPATSDRIGFFVVYESAS